MTLNKNRAFSFQNLLIYLGVLIIWSCASIQRPMGGPRDKTPPKLLKAVPINQTKNFTAKIIQLDFDEYFKLANPFQEITVSPTPEKNPEYLVRNKSLIIKFKDTLSKNTTYVINFGKAIADVNEGNLLKNFTYVFSTGAHIDSLNLSGFVTDPQSEEIQKDVTVMLFPVKKDSLLFGKKKPSIYTTTDTSGHFMLSNLHDGDYKIYALKEKSPNKIYDNEDEKIAFLKNTIHLKKDTSEIHLILFEQTPAKLRILEKKIENDGKLFFRFNKPIINPGVKFLDAENDLQKIVEFSKTADTASIYLKSMAFDSVKVSFLSNGQPLDTLTLHKGKKDTYKRRLAFQYNTSGDDKLKPGTDLLMTTNYPIDNIDQSRITLTEDSVNISEFNIQRDVNNLKKFTLKYRWKPDKQYILIFNEGSFTSIYGDKNTRLSKNIALDRLDNYGNLSLKVTLPDTGQYIVELLNSQDMVLRSDIINTSKILTYRNYPTALYRVKVIYDTNRNGKWDTGNIKLKKYPENIWLYTKGKIADIKLRPNWDVEEPIVIPKEIKAP